VKELGLKYVVFRNDLTWTPNSYTPANTHSSSVGHVNLVLDIALLNNPANYLSSFSEHTCTST
jgi:hypothetical protein